MITRPHPPAAGDTEVMRNTESHWNDLRKSPANYCSSDAQTRALWVRNFPAKYISEPTSKEFPG